MSREHASGYVRGPCKGHGIGCMCPPKAEHRKWLVMGSSLSTWKLMQEWEWYCQEIFILWSNTLDRSVNPPWIILHWVLVMTAPDHDGLPRRPFLPMTAHSSLVMTAPALWSQWPLLCGHDGPSIWSQWPLYLVTMALYWSQWPLPYLMSMS